MKLTGNGGTVDKDGSPIAKITSFSFDESEGNVYGQKQCNVSIDTIADSAAIPLRHGGVFDLVLTVSDDAAWTIAITDAKVESSSVDIGIDSTVKQKVKLVSKVTAVIA